MDEYKAQLQQEKREVRAKDVLIVFPTPGNKQIFNVVDAENNLKYNGNVNGQEPHKTDYCSCKSFENGNDTKAEGSYINTHGYAFQCKHIIAAREVRNQ